MAMYPNYHKESMVPQLPRRPDHLIKPLAPSQLNYFSLVLPSIFEQLGLFFSSIFLFSRLQLRILSLSPEEQHRKLSVLTSSTVTLPRIDVASAYASARVPQRKKKKKILLQTFPNRHNGNRREPPSPR